MSVCVCVLPGEKWDTGVNVTNVNDDGSGDGNGVGVVINK